MKNYLILLIVALLSAGCTMQEEKEGLKKLEVSGNGRFLQDEDGNPFFWLGDTGWLLFTKLNREEAEKYLDNRAEKGFNVIQVMVLHTLSARNFYGDSALVNNDISRPLTTEGNSFEDETAYDYWDHMDYVIKLAEKRGIYMALVPVWGSNVKAGLVSREQAGIYAAWLADRYREQSNIIWMNGGDTPGNDSTETWITIGRTLREHDSNHLITFHPRGRMQSSWWFHNEDWLNFNMFQSGHRRYDQDDTNLHYGEDNWRYVQTDYNLIPAKPTIDGEPSYEGIPQGLHDPEQPFWNDNDVRRYAYWSVFAGAFGFTYGHSSIMQFYRPEDRASAYGAKIYWTEALDAPGSFQMIHLKELMLAEPYFSRVPDHGLIPDTVQGERYNYLAATTGSGYAYIYTYNGRDFSINGDTLEGNLVKASWFNPRTGEPVLMGDLDRTGMLDFDPPGDQKDGNDWVLILETETL